MAEVPTTDQIRQAIDNGATGEKVGFPDPATAPMGTDAEAGGHPATRADRAVEARSKVFRKSSHPPVGFAVYIGLLVLIAVAALVILFAAR